MIDPKKIYADMERLLTRLALWDLKSPHARPADAYDYIQFAQQYIELGDFLGAHNALNNARGEMQRLHGAA